MSKSSPVPGRASGAGRQRVGSHFLVLLGAQVGSALLQAMAVLLMARWLLPESFGLFASVVGLLTVLVSMSDLGLSTLAVRSRAKDQDDPAVIRMVRWASIQTVVVGLVGTLVAILMVGQGASRSGIAMLGLYAVSDRLLQIQLGVTLADRRPVVNLAALAFARIMLVLGLCLGVIVLNASPIVSYGLAGALGGVAAAIVVRRISFRPFATPATVGLREHVRSARPFWIASMSALARTLDVPIVAMAAGSLAAGIYAVPARVSAPLRLLPLTLNKMAIPYASSRDFATIRKLHRMMRLIVLLMLGAAIILMIWAESFISLVVGVEYEEAAWPLRIILLGLVVNVAGSFKSGILQGIGDERFVSRVGVVLGILSCFMVGVLAYLFGAIGAASGVSTIFVVQFLVMSIRFHKHPIVTVSERQ